MARCSRYPRPATRIFTWFVWAVSLTGLGCHDQAPPPVLAGQFSGAADVDHETHGMLSQLPVSISIQQDESMLTGSFQLGTTTFDLTATVDLSLGHTVVQLNDAVAAGNSPSACNGYNLSGEALFIQKVNDQSSGPLSLRGELAGTDCDGMLTVTFEADRQ